jgi:hypothetical protein
MEYGHKLSSKRDHVKEQAEVRDQAGHQKVVTSFQGQQVPCHPRSGLQMVETPVRERTPGVLPADSHGRNVVGGFYVSP